MHELSIINNLMRILEKVREENSAKAFLQISITVNIYSCIDEDNINFIFRSMTKNNPLYKKAHIEINRNSDPASREFVLDNVEIEVQ